MSRYNRIYEFSLKYLRLFDNEPDSGAGKQIEESLGRDCESLNFIMDSGEAFKKAYYCAYVSNDVMRGACRLITDIDLLGSGIYSQWKYYTHWGQVDFLSPKPKEWFTMAFSRLAELALFPLFEGNIEKIVIESEDSGFCPFPILSPKGIELMRPRLRPCIFLNYIQLGCLYIKCTSFRIFNLDIIFRHFIDFDFFDSAVNSKPMVFMHDIIPDT